LQEAVLGKEKLQLELTQVTERARHDLGLLKEKTDLESQKGKMGLERQLQAALEREQEALLDAD
jgi:uncharacterized protein YutE (UPF0331/DUF86 family)